jgi:dTDP-3-amino-2,3,6-trideoxy-4-keto-D-glucose/dTDP-3-amino-3,4,6-trideoxy-alpha-D-glucose/dTDP-2,6-dideoxy-D-kanosamine transaminase
MTFDNNMTNKTLRNFLPEQYESTGQLEINHNYLQSQFSDYEEIFQKISKVITKGDFTLGREVDLLEEEFSVIAGTKFAVGVGSGTDALLLSLKALGIGPGDEVITTPYTFYATVGAIVTAGATPVFVDIGDDYNINPDLIKDAITVKTRSILPVHWSGKPCDISRIDPIAQQNNLFIVEDACHAVNASYEGRPAGSLGDIGCFSFHPLKNLNVWGDGGIATTDSEELANKLRLLRNHGLVSRDECAIFAYNSRLDTIQAVVARHMLKKLSHITDSRIANARYFDLKLENIPQIKIPIRDKAIKQVFHLYIISCENRDELQKYLVSYGVDAKVHYSIPMHLQPAAASLGYKLGDFPVCEKMVSQVLSLPVHEFITEDQCARVVELIQQFYGYKQQ